VPSPTSDLGQRLPQSCSPVQVSPLLSPEPCPVPHWPAAPLSLQVAKFMSKYGDMQQFPVKVQVPLLFTVYALLAFKKFKPLGDKEAVGGDFFTVPAGYT
jgi:hypothetical protein